MTNHKKFFNVKEIALTALLMVVGFGLFAAGPQGKDEAKNRKKKKQNITSVAKTLSADELALYESVEQFYQENYAKLVNSTEANSPITKVIVYDMAGNVLQEQNAAKKKIDLSVLPAKAKLLMTDNGTQFYLVAN